MNAPPGTRSRILEVALACFLEHGYEGTTVARIREASGVSNGALFHHFPSKDAIAGALYADAITDFQEEHWRILQSPPATLREGIDAIVTHHLEWVQAHPDRARFLYEAGQPGGDCEPLREVRRRNAELAAAYAAWYLPLVERGEARMVKPGLVVAIVSGPAHAVCRHWLGGSRTRDLARHAEELAHAAWAGLAGPAALGAFVAPTEAPVEPPPVRPARLRIEVLADDGTSLGTTDAELPGPPR